ncbi:hypothetical protein HMI56_000788, partial [Coelomomyces lativittatus]
SSSPPSNEVGSSSSAPSSPTSSEKNEVSKTCRGSGKFSPEYFLKDLPPSSDRISLNVLTSIRVALNTEIPSWVCDFVDSKVFDSLVEVYEQLHGQVAKEYVIFEISLFLISFITCLISIGSIKVKFFFNHESNRCFH